MIILLHKIHLISWRLCRRHVLHLQGLREPPPRREVLCVCVCVCVLGKALILIFLQKIMKRMITGLGRGEVLQLQRLGKLPVGVEVLIFDNIHIDIDIACYF